jgi:hypothetical protein
MDLTDVKEGVGFLLYVPWIDPSWYLTLSPLLR